MIQVFDTANQPRVESPEGHVRIVLSPARDGTRVRVVIADVDPGRPLLVAASQNSQVVYVLEGGDVSIVHTRGEAAAEHRVQRRAGIYLEPGETATVTSEGPLQVLYVAVPKHTGRPNDAQAPAGYVFEEARLRALVDEKGVRERTFWVNKETGLSDSWDLQIGRMLYAPHAHSPRHVHHASKTSPVTPEHFYFIERGTGEVRHDTGTLAVGPGSLVLIPAGEWHQLLASDSGFDYVEFQAPFDFATTMDHDPLGKNWYIKGTDDGTGKPQRWVQS
jgi:mannose-6-phosphate isomerase-like protein (cupin superfamily)